MAWGSFLLRVYRSSSFPFGACGQGTLGSAALGKGLNKRKEPNGKLHCLHSTSVDAGCHATIPELA